MEYISSIFHLLVFMITGILRMVLGCELLGLKERSGQNPLPVRAACSKREDKMCGPTELKYKTVSDKQYKESFVEAQTREI